MKKLATRNHPERGVERVLHDGDTEVVEPDEIPVSQEERLEYYDNGSPEEEESKIHKRKNIETSFDDGGNPMWVNESHRTSLPRPHQYSIERRLQEQRDPGSTYDITSNASLEQATAKAFAMVSPHVMAGTDLDNSAIVKISSSTGVPVSNVISLERIAKNNIELARKYAGIPGVVVDEDPRLEKESDPGRKIENKKKKRRRKSTEPLTEEELNQIGVDSGLCD